MMTIIKFFACLALLQLAHAFIIASTDGEWTGRETTPILIAIVIDAVVLITLLA